MTTKRILIADDTADMRDLLRMVMIGTDVTIVGEAADGDEALDLWHTHRDSELFAVILDQRMPGRTGLEVAREILAEAPEQRVILFSANVDPGMRTEAAALGVAAVIAKDEVLRLPHLPIMQR